MSISIESLRSMSEREFCTKLTEYAQQSPNEASTLLQELMTLAEPEIRSQALVLLQKLFRNAVESNAIDALADDVWLVRTTAIDVLSRIRSSKATQTIVQMLEADEDECVRSWSVFYFGLFGDASAIPPLLRCVTTDTGVDHEGTPISEIASKAIDRIRARCGIG